MHFVIFMSELGPEPGHNERFLNTFQVTLQEKLYISPRDTLKLDNDIFSKMGAFNSLQMPKHHFINPNVIHSCRFLLCL